MDIFSKEKSYEYIFVHLLTISDRAAGAQLEVQINKLLLNLTINKPYTFLFVYAVYMVMNCVAACMWFGCIGFERSISTYARRVPITTISSKQKSTPVNQTRDTSE